MTEPYFVDMTELRARFALLPEPDPWAVQYMGVSPYKYVYFTQEQRDTSCSEDVKALMTFHDEETSMWVISNEHLPPLEG